MADKIIRTALMSYGMSGEVFHGPLLRAHPGFDIAAVYQRRPPESPKHPHRVVSSPDDIFSDPEIELVVINTPNDSHFSYAKAALSAGKHVVVEKPFTVTSPEADELIGLAAKNRRVLTVFQNRRWDGDFLTVKDIIEKKALGRLVEFEAHYDRFRNVIDTKSWKEESLPGTGLLYNLGSHMLDQVMVLFGIPQFLDARLGIQRPGGKVHDYYDIRMQYRDLLVILKSGYLVREQGPRYILHGTEGSFVKYGIDPQEEELKAGRVPGGNGWGMELPSQWGKLNTGSYNGPVETVPGNYPAFYDSVYDAVRHGKLPAVSAQQSRDVIRMIEACYRSNTDKCAVQVS